MRFRVDACFQRNDLRCIYGKEINEHLTRYLGNALVCFLKCKKVIVGHDMRISSPSLCDSLIKGILEAGADVVHLGMVDTPALYFASGFLKMPGVMITASHNPTNYNGFKIVKSGAVPIGESSGLEEIKKIICEQNLKTTKKKGRVFYKNIIKDYKKFLHSFIDLKKLARLKVVVDAGNGMAGKMVSAVYRGLPFKIIEMYFKLDGRFPNHIPNPAIEKNLRELKKRVGKEKADMGIAFDGDMDRVVFVDDRGNVLNSSLTAGLLIKHLLKKNKNRRVVYNLVMSKLVPEIIRENGGRAFREKVGHSYIKARMRREGAFFGCEHTGHFYYKNNYYADSGFITSLLMLELLSLYKKDGKKLSEVVNSLQRYMNSDEISMPIDGKERVIEKVEKFYKTRNGFRKSDYLDGLTMEFDNFWFNIRPSGTETLLRVNLEARSREIMRKELRRLLRVIKNRYSGRQKYLSSFLVFR